MAGVKFMVIYPRPTDIEAFEKVYQDEHVPMAVEKLAGKTKLVATKVLASPRGSHLFTVSPRFTSHRLKPWKPALVQQGRRRHWPMPCLSPPEEARSFWSLRSGLSLSSKR
jgi:hypothetical protein